MYKEYKEHIFLLLYTLLRSAVYTVIQYICRVSSYIKGIHCLRLNLTTHLCLVMWLLDMVFFHLVEII
jgi:hypothetical protein